jgi:hypothetical protein
MGGGDTVFRTPFKAIRCMKSPCFAGFLMFWAFSAFAEQIRPAVSSGPSVQVRSSVVSRPPLELVQRVFEASGLKKSNPVLVLDYDDSGAPVKVSLDPASGNELLDQSILEWGLQVRFAPGHPGTKRLPFDLIDAATEESGSHSDIHFPEISAADLVRVPPMQPVAQVMSNQKIHFASVQLLIEYDTNGKVSSAHLEQSTGNDALDSAFIHWAKRLKMKSGVAGKGRFPIEIQGKSATAVDAAINRL